jgi:hypothetical protein
MRRLRPGLALIFALVSLALLSAAAPSWAHTGATARLSNATPAQSIDALPTTDEARRPFTLSGAPKAPGLPWPALLGAILAAGLGWRRPRRALVLAVVLLLAVFAFEDGLHSVHHLVDRSQLNKCAVAFATAHLNATAVVDSDVSNVILPVIAVAADTGQTDPIARFLRPVQGRAPPIQTV